MLQNIYLTLGDSKATHPPVSSTASSAMASSSTSTITNYTLGVHGNFSNEFEAATTTEEGQRCLAREQQAMRVMVTALQVMLLLYVFPCYTVNSNS
jgi:hypothetical protein